MGPRFSPAGLDGALSPGPVPAFPQLRLGLKAVLRCRVWWPRLRAGPAQAVWCRKVLGWRGSRGQPLTPLEAMLFTKERWNAMKWATTGRVIIEE